MSDPRRAALAAELAAGVAAGARAYAEAGGGDREVARLRVRLPRGAGRDEVARAVSAALRDGRDG